MAATSFAALFSSSRIALANCSGAVLLTWRVVTNLLTVGWTSKLRYSPYISEQATKMSSLRLGSPQSTNPSRVRTVPYGTVIPTESSAESPFIVPLGKLIELKTAIKATPTANPEITASGSPLSTLLHDFSTLIKLMQIDSSDHQFSLLASWIAVIRLSFPSILMPAISAVVLTANPSCVLKYQWYCWWPVRIKISIFSRLPWYFVFPGFHRSAFHLFTLEPACDYSK